MDADSEGFCIHSHSIQEAYFGLALELFEEAQRLTGEKNALYTIEDIKTIYREDIYRLSKLDVIVFIQPDYT